MKQYSCPHCGQDAFATLCTDCQAEGIKIEYVRSVFHLGRCPRCGHLDDEPCSARIGRGRIVARVWDNGRQVMQRFGRLAARLAARAAESFRNNTVRIR